MEWEWLMNLSGWNEDAMPDMLDCTDGQIPPTASSLELNDPTPSMDPENLPSLEHWLREFTDELEREAQVQLESSPLKTTTLLPGSPEPSWADVPECLSPPGPAPRKNYYPARDRTPYSREVSPQQVTQYDNVLPGEQLMLSQDQQVTEPSHGTTESSGLHPINEGRMFQTTEPSTADIAQAAASSVTFGKRKREAEDDKHYIKKPPNAFMLYRAEQRETIKREFNIRNSAEVNKILGERWKMLPAEVQAPYFELARVAKKEHEAKYPGWSACDNFGKKKRRKANTTIPMDYTYPAAPVHPEFYNIYNYPVMLPQNYYQAVQQIPGNTNPTFYNPVMMAPPTTQSATTIINPWATTNVNHSAGLVQPTNYYTPVMMAPPTNQPAPTNTDNVNRSAAHVQTAFDNQAQMLPPAFEPTPGKTNPRATTNVNHSARLVQPIVSPTNQPAPSTTDQAAPTNTDSSGAPVKEVFRMPKFRIVSKTDDYVSAKKCRPPKH